MPTLREHHAKASRVMPGGVNSSVRLNRAIGTPFFVARAKGSRVWSLEGREFIDLCCAHGAALLGHAHPGLDRAMHQAAAFGYAHAFETEFHEQLAARLCELVPCADRIRFCSSGSEATLHLIRACREFTGRDKIIRVEGHFHGYHEMIYIGGQPPAAALPGNRAHPYVESPGIPAGFADYIIPVPFNDVTAMTQAIAEQGSEVALVILEPVNFNSGGIQPEPGYLEAVRRLTRDAGIVLFFDEIQSIFKRSPGGAQQDLGVVPDVCTIGKAIGGGLPLSAFCGRADIMDRFQPVGPVQHSGTFNAHLVPVLAGLSFLDEAAKPEFYAHLRQLEATLHAGVDRIIRDHDLTMIVPHYGARFNILLGRKTPPRRYEDVFCHDRQLMLEVVRGCYERGVYLHDYGGAPAHHGYSIQHTLADIGEVLHVWDEVLGGMKMKLKAAAPERS
ncbi:MAG: aspartate aminotransferase family protein [Opitutales bacterium]